MFKSIFQELLGFIDDGKLDSFMFRLFDSNNDGHIDFKEFWMAMYVMSKGTKEQKLKQVNNLNIKDQKGSYYISSGFSTLRRQQ